MAADFIGREQVVQHLNITWTHCKLFGISGLRSVGKSRLVQEFIIVKQREYLEYGLTLEDVVVDLRNSFSLRRIFNKLCEALKVEKIRLDRHEIMTDIINGFSAKNDCVVIFDNAEDIIDRQDLYMEFKEFCFSLMEHCTNVKIFITSTTDLAFSKDCLFVDLIFEMQLQPFSFEESIEFLKTIAPSVDFGIYLESIVKLCEGLPLALLMISSELEDKDSLYTPEEMVQNLTTFRLQALSGEFYPKTEQIAPVYVKFLERLSTRDQESLAVLGYIPGTFSVRQASAILDDISEDATMEETLVPISRRHIILHDSSSQRFDIQGILRDCVSVFYKIQNLSAVRKRFCFIFSAILQEISLKLHTKLYLEALTTFNLEHQNFQKLLTDVIHCTEDTYKVFIDLACNASGAIQSFMGREGFQFYTECIRLSQQNKMEIDEALVRISYGAALTNIQNDLKNGESHYKLAITVIENRDDYRYQLALSHQRLGWNLGCQGRVAEALRVLEKALELETTVHLEKDHNLILQTLNSLGIFHAFADNFEESEKYSFESVKRRKQLYGTEMHPYIGACYNNIGLLFRRAGKFNMAVDYFKKGLDIKLKTKASDTAIAISENNVAMCLANLEEYEAALDTIETAFDRLSKFPGLYANALAQTLDTKGQILLLQRNFKDSAVCLEDAVQMKRKLTPGNVSLVESLVRLAQACVGMEQYSQAIAFIDEAMELKQAAIEMPTNIFIVDGYETTIEAQLALSDRNNVKLQSSYEGAIIEVLRLLGVYEQFGNKMKIELYENKLNSLKEKYFWVQSNNLNESK